MVAWMNEDGSGFSMSFGFASGFGFDLFIDALNDFSEVKEWNKLDVIFSQWIGGQADVEFLALPGEEQYHGIPSFGLYGGNNQFAILNYEEEDLPLNLKLAYGLVPLLDIAAATWNLIVWEDTSDMWLVVWFLQYSIGLLALIVYGIAWAFW